MHLVGGTNQLYCPMLGVGSLGLVVQTKRGAVHRKTGGTNVEMPRRPLSDEFASGIAPARLRLRPRRHLETFPFALRLWHAHRLFTPQIGNTRLR